MEHGGGGVIQFRSGPEPPQSEREAPEGVRRNMTGLMCVFDLPLEQQSLSTSTARKRGSYHVAEGVASQHRGPTPHRLRTHNVRGVLKGKKSVPERQFCKKTARSSYVQPWLVAIGGWWRLAVGGGWWLVAIGS